MTRDFDKIFEQEGRGIPSAFLRALAQRESASNPLEAKGPAWGLLQVGIDKRAGNVLKSYNERFGADLTPQDMLDPRLNVRVAAELLSRIISLYNAEGIKTDWGNANFVGLVVAGWNSGWSPKAGTVRMVRYLKAKGIPVTLDNVYAHSKKAGATKHLSNPKKQTWQRSVVASHFREAGIPASSEREGLSEWVPLLLLLLSLT